MPPRKDLRRLEKKRGVLFDDAIIGFGGQRVHNAVYDGKDGNGADYANCEKGDVCKVHKQKKLCYHLKGKGNMDHSHAQRQEEYNEYLASDGFLYLVLAQPDLLHDFKALLVLIALGKLLVIDYQNGRHQENQTEEHSEEKKAAVHAVDKAALRLAAGGGKAYIAAV